MVAEKISHPQKNPLISAREKLGLSRFDVAALSYASDSLIGHLECGRLVAIPTPVIEAMAPYLEQIGSSPEQLQSAYRDWRAGLATGVRRKADRFCMALRQFPGLEIDPNDTDLIEKLLTDR